MKDFNLQLFATVEPTPGSHIIYKYRVLEDAAKEDAWALGFVTENETDISVDSDSTQTKDGTIVTPSNPEIEIKSTSIMLKGDIRLPKIKAACKAKKTMEIWEINLDSPATSGSNKYAGTYYQGICSEYDESSDSDDTAKVELTFKINGNGADGDCTVTSTEVIEASYVFADTTKVTSG